MPRVPTYDSFQATPNTLPQNQLQGGQFTPIQDVAGQQAQQLGRSMTQAGGEIGRLAMNIQDQANRVRVDDSANLLKEFELKMQYDKDVGFTNIKGINALQRDSGKPLAEEYGEQFQKEIARISEGLGNDAQRQAFGSIAREMQTRFTGSIMAHEADEFKTYTLSVADGTAKTAMRDIALNYNNPDAVGQAQERLKASVYQQAQLLGKSATWAEAQMRQLSSGAHKLVVATALEKGNLAYAQSYLSKYSKDMEADDILTARTAIDGGVDIQTANAAASNVWNSNYANLNPTQFDKLWNGLIHQESGGRQTSAQGAPVTSPKGAIGIAQVMPETAKYVAKKNGIPWDESRYKNDAAYNENLGKLYFQEQLQDFGGDVAKALAAYNAGPGSASSGRGVRGAMAKAEKAGRPDDWLSFMPAETRNYVPSILSRMDRGEGVVRKPTLAELKAQLRQDPALANNPKRLKLAVTDVESRFKDNEAATKQRDEETLSAAMQQLYDNGGNIKALPPELLTALPPDKLDSMMSFADRVVKSGKQNDPEAWARIMSLPKEQLAMMSPIEFYREYRPHLDDLHLEKGYALLESAGNRATDKHLEIISTPERIKQAAIKEGVLPATGKPDENQIKQFATFQNTIDARVREFERNDLGGKRKASSQELQKIIDDSLMDKVFVARSLWADSDPLPLAFVKPEHLPNAAVTVNDETIKIASIPPGRRAQIVDALQSNNIPVTEQRIAEYWVRAGKPKD